MIGLFGRRLAVVALLAVAGVLRAPAQPPLTTIQDVLYKADGTRFSGTAVIEWKSFEAVDLSNIPTQSVSVRIHDGNLRVRLVPTTNSLTKARYTVRYNSDGRIQFIESWSVPPSALPLRVRDVRVASTTGPGPGPDPQVQIAISDVTGLSGELAIRPFKGLSYLGGHAAVINADGALDAAAGDPGDCVRVDGTSVPCGGTGGAGPAFRDGQTPAGSLDGVNRLFTLLDPPDPAGSLLLYRNGVLQKLDLDYTLSGNVVNFPGEAVPQPGDILQASYRIGGTATSTPLILCSGTGNSSNLSVPASLANCTIPPGTLRPGDRLDIRFDYSHEGSATDFSVAVVWGATTLASRSIAAAESVVGGRADAAVHSLGTQYQTLTWGSLTALAAGSGTAPDSLSEALIIDFLGQMQSPTADSITLRSYSVIYLPSQVNP